ncbi:MAG: hypothetical protein QJR03_07200, partial [Sphaerobacter sp.]|nr:hypothetical protein [Sphaerobacter sp.]
WPHRSGAVGFIRTIDPVVAIVDLWLPRPDDGWTLLDELRRTPETAGLPVILTTTPPLDFRQPAVPRPLDNCELLTKPFDLDDLLAAVQRAGPLPRVREGLFCALCA